MAKIGEDEVARIPSPCISVCRMDPFEDRCVGCLRTLDEIAHWREYSQQDREQIMRELLQRRTKRAPR